MSLNKYFICLFFLFSSCLYADDYGFVYGHNNEGYRYFGVERDFLRERGNKQIGWQYSLGLIQHSEDNNEILDLGSAFIYRINKDRFYVEAGFGPHIFSRTRLGHKNFSTALQFGSHIGVGRKFGKVNFHYKFRHLSNGSIDIPNPGVNLHMISFGFEF